MGGKIHFTKMHGAGNDFIIVDADVACSIGALSSEPYRAQMVRRLCDRHFGVGADGFVFASSATHGEVTMDFYNADGSRATFCGNGARCVARYAMGRGWIAREGIVQAPVGPVACRALPDGRVAIHMPDAPLPFYDAQQKGYIVNTGVPHFVAEAYFESDRAFGQWAEPLRWGVQGESGGVNVNAYHNAGGAIYVRTYERGVEGETLACGTGAVATALTIAFTRHQKAGRITLRPRGGELGVDYTLRADGNGFNNIWLSGGAEHIAEGSFFYGTN